MKWIKKIYLGLVNLENTLRHPFLLIIRIYWGTLLLLTGLGKLTNIDGITDMLDSLGIPFPHFSAYLVGIFEFLGGISLLLGLFARLFSVPLVIIFITAYATAHQKALAKLFSNPSLFISQNPFLYLYTTLVVLCFGSGLFSLDHWFEKKIFGKNL